ncbi:MAG: response regulator [Candidatus Competibacteraceae bacterium]|jgi:CheY-like chemotaxis protein|nr:response regulator [Candidatus Competibacteraceae bacterium]
MPSAILVVDDEPLVRENLKAYLEDEGMTVMAVSSGEEAVQCVQSGEQFAVCIMDMRLPGMDGNASIRHLHALCPKLSFVVHTGSSDYALPPDLKKLALDEEQIYLKPLLDMQPLAKTVRRLMEGDARDAG